MVRSAFEALGATKEQSERMKQAFDVMDRKSIVELAEHYDPDVPTAENEVYAAKVRERAATWEADLNAEIAEILGRK